MYHLPIYIYNIIFVILYLWVVNICSNSFKITNQNIFHLLQLLYVILIIDSVFAFSFESISFPVNEQIVFNRGYYLFRMIIFAIAADLYIKIFVCILKQKIAFYWYIPIIITLLIELIRICVFFDSEYSFSWQRSIQDGSILILCIIYFMVYHRENNNLLKSEMKPYNRAIKIGALFMFFSCLEKIIYDYINIQKIPILFDLIQHLNFNEVCISEDLYSVILSLMIIRFSKLEQEKARKQQLSILVQQKMNQYQAMLQETKVHSEENQVINFCNYYHMTPRESEILRLILKGKKNQDIADELFISVGTVKAHIYSIFKKLEIERRSQLMRIFMEYSDNKNN